MIIDPICGMQVTPQSSIKVTKDGVDYFFCSTHCRDRFIQQEGIKDTAACCSPPRKPFYKHKLFMLTVIVGAFLLASLYLPWFVPFRKAFLLYLKSIWWAVLLGLFLGGIIDYYIPREYVSKVLARRSPMTILNAVLLGFLMSACSHGILALAIQIHKKGASNPAIVSFLLASPWANPAITIMLISLFGLKGILIIIAAIVVALNTGFIFMFLEHRGLTGKNKNTVSVADDFSIIKDIKTRAKHYAFGVHTLVVDGKGVLGGAWALADMVLWWIILGVFISSLAGAYIPAHFFHKFMGPTVVGLLVTLSLATVIEVCSEGSSPLAFEIYRQTGALGNSFVFLMAGVATDYTEIGLLWSNVGRRVALWMPLIAVPQIIVVGYVMNRILK